MERKFIETKISERSNRFGHDAASPELLGKPVTKFRSVAMNVAAKMNTDSTNSHTVDFNAKICRRLRSRRVLQKFVRVIGCVRMRKRIAECQPDSAIVRVLRKRLGIIHLPRPNRALFQRQLHSLPRHLNHTYR